MASASATGRVEKSGYLKIKRPPSSGKVRLKAWQSKYFVLRDIPPVFEYFKDELSYHVTRSSKERNRISLENVIHIGATDASKTQRNAFMIVDSHHGALMFASETDQDAREWIEALNRVAVKNMSPNECPDLGSLVYPDQSPPLPTRRSISNASPTGSPVLVDAGVRRGSAPPSGGDSNQGFLVTTRLTPSSEKNGIRDNYIMHITEDHVVLNRLDSNVPVISWPLVGLRGWKSEPVESAGLRGTRILTLESGRKSTTGEGLFQFFSHFGDQIAAKIRAHSKVLCASAVQKREKFKHDRSNSFEDLANSCSGEEIMKKSLTEPRPSLGLSHTLTMGSLAESDSLRNFDKIEQPKLSPSSSRKELLQGMCSKNVNSEGSQESDSLPADESNAFAAQPTDNAYLDLISESGVEPVHISDPEHRITSSNSEEGVLISKCSIPSIDESKEPSDYIDESEINIYRSQETNANSIKGRVSQCRQFDGSYSDPVVCTSSESTRQTQGAHDTQFFQDFFEQLSNPTAHKASVFLQHQSQLKSNHISKSVNQELDNKETVSPDTTLASSDIGKPSHVLSVVSNRSVTCQGNVCDDAEVTNQENKEIAPKKMDSNFERSNSEERLTKCIESTISIEIAEESVDQSHSKVGQHGNFHKLLKRSDETQDLLQRCLVQLESPQTFAQQDLFPHFPKHDSTGIVGLDKTNVGIIAKDGKLKVKSLTISSDIGAKKLIEKSKSHSGIDSKHSEEMPPPLPARKEMGHARTRSSCSMGDIFENIQRRPEQFPKGINRQLSPIGTPAFGASCGPESLVTARLLQRTTSGSNLVASEKRSLTHLPINDSKHELKSLMSEVIRPRSSSLRSSRDSKSQSSEDVKSTDNDGESSKCRRGSKASKLFNKVLNNFSLPPVITTKRRASCDSLSPEALKDVEALAKRGSAVNTGIDNEGWSPETSLDVPTPEGSPKLFRKTTSALRRASHDPSLGRKHFLGSPTFDSKNEELKQKARERERERAALPHQPPPALPPRKKSDPPPLPPRRSKSGGDHSCPSSPPSRAASHEHSSSTATKIINSRASFQKGSGSSYDDETSPPPIPPRRDERRGSQPPAIQLTVSSPENKCVDKSLDGLPEEPSSNSPVKSSSTLGRHSTEDPMQVTRPPRISSTLSIDTDVSCPVPKRPLKSKTKWSRQQPVELLDSFSLDKEISGPRELSRERKPFEPCQDSEESTSKLEKNESAFISIGFGEERAKQSHQFEVSGIELDSLTSTIHSKSSSVTDRINSSTPLNSVEADFGSKGTSERCSPGHSPPLSLNIPKRGSVVVLGDSGSTTPISV